MASKELIRLTRRYVESRNAMFSRLCRLAGTDPEGGILPPAAEEIDRTPNPWWKNPRE